jgi:hypothetical protein
MGSVLAASVIHNVQAKDAEHPDGWTFGQLSALFVIAESANYKTGACLSSMTTLAASVGAERKTFLRAAERAIAEGLCTADWCGYQQARVRRLTFPNPRRIVVEGTSEST